MPVTITHTQVRSVQVGPAYRTVDTVTASAGIPPQTFVFLVSDDSFQNVATVDNMLNLPSTKAQAILDGKDAYRLAAVQKDFAILSDAEYFATTLSQRMARLVIEYDAAVNEFVGTTTETLSS